MPHSQVKVFLTKIMEEVTASSYVKTHKATGIIKNQGNMVPLKEHSKPLVTGSKEMEIQGLPDNSK